MARASTSFLDLTRTLDQNAKLHAMCGDVASQVQWAGMRLGLEDWKRLLVDAWLRATGQTPSKVVPSLDMKGIVALGVQTRKLKKSQLAELIEFIYAWGSDNNVIWSDEHAPTN